MHLLASLPPDEETDESDSDYVDEEEDLNTREDKQNNEDDFDFDDEDDVGVDATEEARILWQNSFNSLQLNLLCRHKKSAQRQQANDQVTHQPLHLLLESPNFAINLLSFLLSAIKTSTVAAV